MTLTVHLSVQNGKRNGELETVISIPEIRNSQNIPEDDFQETDVQVYLHLLLARKTAV